MMYITRTILDCEAGKLGLANCLTRDIRTIRRWTNNFSFILCHWQFSQRFPYLPCY